MLHQISWTTYLTAVLLCAAAYYGYMLLRFYRTEIGRIFSRLTGRQALAGRPEDLLVAEAEVMGPAQPEAIDQIKAEDLDFGPPEIRDRADEPTIRLDSNSRLIGQFSEMVSEVKTLIRVINEFSETKENFEMLFRLIVQKHEELAGTTYQEQINEFLMAEGAPEFPFDLERSDLNNYWIERPNNDQL